MPSHTVLLTYCHPLSLNVALPFGLKSAARALLYCAIARLLPALSPCLVICPASVTTAQLMDPDPSHLQLKFAIIQSRHPELVSRSEEHTSELQSLMRISYAVFCLKKKNNIHHIPLYNFILIHIHNNYKLSIEAKLSYSNIQTFHIFCYD